jgi:hypothetical protein
MEGANIRSVTMKFRALAIAGLFGATLALPGVAEAALGFTNTNANMRTGPGTGYARIATIPAGARIEVFDCARWCSVMWRGMQGYVAASLISGGVEYRRPGFGFGFGPPRFIRPPPPAWGYVQPPWWDSRYQAWYDGNRWYYNGRWYERPSGFYLGFRFGG